MRCFHLSELLRCLHDIISRYSTCGFHSPLQTVLNQERHPFSAERGERMTKCKLDKVKGDTPILSSYRLVDEAFLKKSKTLKWRAHTLPFTCSTHPLLPNLR